MLKKKLLHRKNRNKKESKLYNGDKFKRKNDIDFFSDLPLHESMRQTKCSWYDFDVKPLNEFLKSKIGCDWNDVYSELLKKIKSNYRYSLDDYIKRNYVDIIYDEYYVPYDRHGRICYDRLFVNINNILTYKSKEELILESKKFLRNQKLKEIIKNYENEIKNQLDD